MPFWVSDYSLIQLAYQLCDRTARVMNLSTVAEYVETENSKNLLAKIGVDFAQGHAVGKPAPLEDLLAQIGSNSQSSTA